MRESRAARTSAAARPELALPPPAPPPSPPPVPPPLPRLRGWLSAGRMRDMEKPAGPKAAAAGPDADTSMGSPDGPEPSAAA
eukprot:SM007919S22562  [mRNA]  locus=s7919:31:693:+ [translate_table: standard]